MPSRSRPTEINVSSTDAPLVLPRPLIRTELITWSPASISLTGSTPEIVELGFDGAEVAANPLVSAVGGRLDPRTGGGPLDLGVQVAQISVETLTLEGLEGTTHDLDVLLRHRTRSISRWGEGSNPMTRDPDDRRWLPLRKTVQKKAMTDKPPRSHSVAALLRARITPRPSAIRGRRTRVFETAAEYGGSALLERFLAA